MNTLKPIEWIELLKSDISAFNAAIASVAAADRVMFRAADLSGLDLRLAHLHYCDFTGACLNDAKLPGLALSRCRLYQTELNNIALDDLYWQPAIQQIQLLWRSAEEWNHFRTTNTPAILESACFQKADLADADLSGMFFTSANFSGADISKCKLEETNFLGANLTKANLSNNLLDHTHFAEANMKEALLDGAVFRFSNLVKADISGSLISHVSFDHTDAHLLQAGNCNWQHSKGSNSLFFDADLSNCRFTNTHFEQCNFNGVGFRRSVFSDASLINCTMSGTDTTDTVFENTQREDAVF
jgi:uncharacterized protein YjbI with pentapeptide repeats